MTQASYKQFLRDKSEVESSLSSAKLLRDRWFAAVTENPTNLTKKEIDHLGKAYKNRLLTVKWDCEDLEELINIRDTNNFTNEKLEEAKSFIAECKIRVSEFMKQFEEVESSDKTLSKHGITLSYANRIANTTQTTTSTVSPSSNGQKYVRLTDNDVNEIHFDKSQVAASSANIFNNVLYDHLEESDDRLSKNFKASQVFNNLTRPASNVYMNPNENEVILDMLETEYFEPPAGVDTKSRLNFAIRKLLDTTDRNRFLGAILFIFSFPLILVFFALP